MQLPPTCIGQPPDVAAVRAVRASFKALTTQVDGFHPRHYVQICEDGRRILGQLSMLMVQVGMIPTSLRMLLIQLIPMVKSVGARPIGFFQSFLRVAGRFLGEDTKRWGKTNAE